MLKLYKHLFVIQELVQKIQQEVAPLVLVFKVLPRCYDRDNKEAMLRRRSLNKKLVAKLKCNPGVRILNPDVSCLCGMLYCLYSHRASPKVCLLQLPLFFIFSTYSWIASSCLNATCLHWMATTCQERMASTKWQK